MANGGRINYTVGFNVDQSGLNQIKSSLASIQQGTTKDFVGLKGLQDADKKLTEIKGTAAEVEAALNRSFNSNLGTLNISKFNQELKKLDVKKVYTDFAQLGPVGQNAFRNITSQILTTNLQLKQTNKWLDEMATTMANSVKWGITSSIWNNMTGAVEKAWGFAKKLDTSLNDIRIVTQKSADDMERYAVAANKAAKNLGQTTTQYTNASLIYYQQGLSDAEVQARTETTLKAANVTGQSAADVSEQLTAVWNGYKVSAQEAELYVDKLSAVAATTAADLEELSTGMSKVASAASIMGVDIDQLNAQLATVVSVTRQAPESVGTAFKTIYARMGDIEAGLDTETSLGDYTKKMNEMGFNVLDTNGKLKDMGSVIDEIGNKWANMSREQQVALSQIMAGTRQYNNLLALFDNWDMYSKAIETSKNATGALQRQQDIYMESMEAHLQQLQTAGEGVYNALFNAEDVNPIIDSLTGVVSLFKNFVDAAGGAQGMLLLLGNTAVSVFSKQIASGLATTIANFKTAKENANQLKAEMEILSKYENANINDSRTQNLINMKRQILDYDKVITEEERNQANEIIKQTNELYKQQDALQNKKLQVQSIYEQMTGEVLLFSNEDMSTAQIQTYSDLIQKEFTEIKGTINFANEGFKEFNQALNAMNFAAKAGDMTKFYEQQNLVAESMKNQAIAAENLLETTTLNEQQRISLTAALKEYERVEQQVANGQKGYSDLIQASQVLQRNYGNVLRENGEALASASKILENMKKEQDNLNNSLTVGQQAWRQYLNQIDLKAKTQQIVNFANMLGKVSMTFTSLNRIGDIFKDVNLSSGEKLLQTMSALSMSIPGLISLGSAIGKVTGLTEVFNAKLALSSALKKKDIANDIAANAQKEIAAIRATHLSVQLAKVDALLAQKNWLTEQEIASMTWENIQQEINNKLTQEGIPLESTEAILLREEIKLRYKNATAMAVETGQQKVKNATTKNIFQNFGNKIGEFGSRINGLSGAAGIAGAAVATIAIAALAVVGTLKIVNRDFESAQKEAKAAAEGVNILSQSYESAKQSFENFQSEIADYTEAQTAIEDMTAGTEEWTEAIEESNRQVIDLISNYKELAQYVSTDENGRMTISDAGLKEAERLEKEKLNKEYQGLASAQYTANKANSKLQIAQTKEDLENFNDIGAGALTGGLAIAGGILGSFIPVVGTVVGAAIGAAIGGLAGGVASIITEENANIQEETLQQVTDAYSLYGEELFSNFSTFSSRLENISKEEAAALWANKESLIELSRSVDENTKAQQIQVQNYAKTAIENKDIYKNSKNKNALSIMVAESMEDGLDEATEKWKDKIGGKTDEEIQKAYAELMGWETTSIDNQTGNKATYYFSDGTSQTIDDAVARNALAMAEAADNAANSLERFEKTATYVSNNMKTLLGDEYALDSFYGGQGGNFSNLTEEQVQTVLNNTNIWDYETVKNMGYESVEAFLTVLKDAGTAYQNQLAENEKEAYFYIGKFYNEIKRKLSVEDLSLTARDNLSKALIEAFKYGGEEGISALADLMNEFPIEQQEEFAKIVNSIDFSDIDAYDQLAIALQNIGLELDNDAWIKYSSYVEDAIRANTDLNSVLDKSLNLFRNLEKTISSIKTGDIISVDEYQKLIESNPELKKNFMTIGKDKEGKQQYQYIGLDISGEEFLKNQANDLYEDYQNDLELSKTAKDRRQRISSSLTDVEEQTFSADRNRFVIAEGVDPTIAAEGMDYINDIINRLEAAATKEERDAIREEAIAKMGSEDFGLTNYIKDFYGYDRPSLSIKTSSGDYFPVVSSKSPNDHDYTGVLKYLFAEELDQNQDGYKDGFANASVFASEIDIENFKKQVEDFVGNLDIDALVDAGYDRSYLNNLMDQFLDFDNKSILQLNDKSNAIQDFIKDINIYVNSTKDIIDTTERENEILATAQDIWQLNDFYINKNIGSSEQYLKKRQLLMRTELLSNGVSNELISSYKEQMQTTYDLSNGVAEMATNLVLLGNVGIKTLKDNWENYANIFNTLEPYTQAYVEAMGETKNALSQILGGTEVSDEFILNNKDIIYNAFVGESQEALDKIRELAAEEIILNVKNKLDPNDKNSEDIIKQIDNFVSLVQEQLDTLEFGDALPDELNDMLIEMLSETGEFSSDMIAYLTAIGFAFNDIQRLEDQARFRALEKAGDYQKIYTEFGSYSGLSGIGMEEELKGTSYSDKTYQKFANSIKDNLFAETTSIEINFTPPSIKDSTSLDDKKGKTSEPSKKDYLEEDRDRYHDINVEIKKLTNNLEDLKTAEEHLTGKDLINNLNQQLKILDKTVARQREKLKIQKQEQKELQAQLKSQGVKFDKDGTIANYNAILDSKMKDVNKAIAYYNSLSKEGQEAYEETLEAIEKDYEDFKEKIERYEELVYDDMQDLEQEIADNISEQISLKIQAFDETVKIELDFTDAKKSWIEFKKELDLAESDIFGRSEFDIKSIEQLLEDIKTYQWSADTTIQDYKEGKAGSENSRFYVDGVFDEKAAMEALREEQENLQNALLAANQKINEVQRSYLDMLDQVQEKLDKQMAGYEHINELINHGLKLTELLSGEDSYKEKSTYYSKMATNYKDQIEMARKEKELWDAEITRAQKAVADATTDQEREIAQEQLDKVVENWRNATNELNSLVEAAIENLQAQYENSIDQALQEMTKKFTNGKSLDYISKEWELINDNADRYLDTVNSTYEVQALEAKYMNAIDSTDSISAQKKLNKVMEEELAALREKDKLTQYDIDRANKKLDITMKQIALEEAQANKSTMRLRRDVQGNYSYQFVADEDEIAKAQQDLLAAQNDLYNFDKEAYEKNLDEAYQAYVQFQEDLKKAAMINDPEERAAYEALIREQYEQKITDLTAINETIRGNLQSSAFEALSGMYNTNEENFKLMNDDILADFSTLTIEDMPNLMGQLVEGWNTGIQQMITSFAGEGGFSAQCQAAYEAIKAAQDVYQNSLKDLEEASGKTFDNIESDIDKDIDKTNDFIEKNDELIDQIRNDLDKQWQLMADTLAKLREEYEKLEEAAKAALDEMMRIQDYEHQENTIIKDDDPTNDNPTSPDSPSNPKKENEEEEEDNPKKGKGEVPSADIMKGVAACIWYGTGAGGWENNPGRKAKLTEKFTSEGQQRIQGLLNNNRTELLNWAKQKGGTNYNQWLADNYSYSKFDTGGYTGEWGAEGRMAMLHEKEIVLNKQDTANILNAVSIVRGIGDLINNLSANLLGSLSQRTIDSTLGMRDFEQNVHITAEFPNVSSSSEIEDALRNLTNVAAQRAFNTRV